MSVNVRRIMRSDHVAGWAFAFPAVALIVVFGVVPIVWSALMSFQKTNLLSTPEWIGLDNYRALPKDPLFKTSMVHASSTRRCSCRCRSAAGCSRPSR